MKTMIKPETRCGLALAPALYAAFSDASIHNVSYIGTIAVSNYYDTRAPIGQTVSNEDLGKIVSTMTARD